MKRCLVSSLLLRAFLVVGLAWTLASCSGLPAIKVPETVKVPVPVACVNPGKRPKPPAIVDTAALMAMDERARTLRTFADRTTLIVYAGELEAVVEGCSRIPGQGSSTATGGPPMHK